MFGNDTRPKNDVEMSTLPGGHGLSRSLQAKKRRNLFVGLGLFITAVFMFAWLRQPHDVLSNIPVLSTSTLPPLYREYHNAELALPQHDTRHPFANGRKYMWVADHAQCEFNNLAQFDGH